MVGATQEFIMINTGYPPDTPPRNPEFIFVREPRPSRVQNLLSQMIFYGGLLTIVVTACLTVISYTVTPFWNDEWDADYVLITAANPPPSGGFSSR
jgi:hypothetical protein